MHKLDKKDRHLLYELDCNSRIPFVDIGKRLKMTPEAIRYRFQKLQEEGVLTSCFAVLDSGKLGFLQYKLFLRFQSVTESDIAEMISYARSTKLVLRIIQFDGTYDLNMVCKVTGLDSFDRFVTNFTSKFSQFIRKRSIAANLWARYLPRNYLIERDRSKHFERGYTTPNDLVELDGINRFILNKLSEDSRTTATDISEQLAKTEFLAPLSSFAVGKRIQALEKQGVISGYTITINHEPLNQVAFKVLLYMNPMSEQETKRFVQYCTKHRHVVHMMKTLGEWDFELDLELLDVRQLHSVMMEITRMFPRVIKDYTTLHYIKVHKYQFLDH